MLPIMGAWIVSHWFDFLQSAGIVSGFFFTAAALRQQTKASRVSTLITLTQNHREIWLEYLRRPDLARVLHESVDLEVTPVNREEETFVKFVIVHLVTAYQARRLKEVAEFGDPRADVGTFFNLPLPEAVWEKIKSVHDQEFVTFVEDARRSSKPA